jgi:deoxyribodipyrimidine photolyase-related protein
LPARIRQRDVILIAEVAEEAAYVRHNRHKIVLIFSAMRHFAETCASAASRWSIAAYDEGVASLRDAVGEGLREHGSRGCCRDRARRVPAPCGDAGLGKAISACP